MPTLLCAAQIHTAAAAQQGHSDGDCTDCVWSTQPIEGRPASAGLWIDNWSFEGASAAKLPLINVFELSFTAFVIVCILPVAFDEECRSAQLFMCPAARYCQRTFVLAPAGGWIWRREGPTLSTPTTVHDEIFSSTLVIWRHHNKPRFAAIDRRFAVRGWLIVTVEDVVPVTARRSAATFILLWAVRHISDSCVAFNGPLLVCPIAASLVAWLRVAARQAWGAGTVLPITMQLESSIARVADRVAAVFRYSVHIFGVKATFGGAGLRMAPPSVRKADGWLS